MKFSDYLTVVKDWPRPGVGFLDIQSLLANTDLFQSAVTAMKDQITHQHSAVVAVESRGFVFGTALALSLGLPLIMARKSGKLPGATVCVDYDTEYSQDRLCIEIDVDAGDHPLIVDDVLATGGTAAAVAKLLRTHFDCKAVSCATMFTLDFLPGKQILAQHQINLYTVEHISA